MEVTPDMIELFRSKGVWKDALEWLEEEPRLTSELTEYDYYWALLVIAKLDPQSIVTVITGLAKCVLPIWNRAFPIDEFPNDDAPRKAVEIAMYGGGPSALMAAHRARFA